MNAPADSNDESDLPPTSRPSFEFRGGSPRPAPPRPSPSPMSHSNPPRAKQQSKSRSAESFGGFIERLWSFTDVEAIRDRVNRWTMNMDMGTAKTYLLPMIALSTLFWVLAVVFDLGPSYIFAKYFMSGVIQPTILDYGFALTADVLGFLTVIVILLTLASTLLEFFAVGFALNSAAISILIKWAVFFDAITDAPVSFSIATKIVEYFTIGYDISAFYSKLVAVPFGIFLLFASTILIETVAISFTLAAWRILMKAIGR